tara:strand:+ start:95 stop:766 length:672 start_codon:yes stop_codon:yes gene_type:complete
MKIASNYIGINHKREKARDDFQAELKKLKTKKTEEVDKIKNDYDQRLKNNIRANREWAATTVKEKEKEFISELQRQANSYNIDRNNLIEDFEDQISNINKSHQNTMKQHDERTQSLLRENADQLSQKFNERLNRFKENARKDKLQGIEDIYKEYKAELKRGKEIHKLQQSHAQNMYRNNLIDIQSQNRIQSQKQENALQNVVEDARYERGKLIREYETKLGVR